MSQSKKIPRLSPARIIGKFLNALALVAPSLAGRLAFDLFCLPLRKRPKPAEAAFLATADLSYQTVNGRQFAVYHWGFRGPIALLVHGWESHSGRWRKIAPLLVQAGYQVVAVDAPAHGRSQGRRFTMIHYADVLRTLLQRIGPVDTIVGHSVGGAASIWAMGTAAPALRPRKAVVMAAFSALRTVMDGARYTIGGSPKLMAAIDAYVVKWSGHSIDHFSIARKAGQLGEVDGLILHDRHDHVTSFGESEILYRAWPNAQFLPTEGFGHGLTAPEVSTAILNFVLEGNFAAV